jgi:hypothetical protein
MTLYPARDIVVDQPVYFRFWLQGVRNKPIDVDFGDGTIIRDYDSYSEILHRFKSPDIHIVTARGIIDEIPIMQKMKVVVSEKAH